MPVEQARSQQRYERILEAALGVFTQRGYRDTTVDDIAEEATTSKGGIYFHFPTKHAIFLALLDRMTAILRSRTAEAVAAETDPLEKASALLRVSLQTFGSHRTLSRLFLVEAQGAGKEFHERLAATRAAFADQIREFLDDAVRQGTIAPLDTTLASRVWFGAVDEVVLWWLSAEPPPPLEETYPVVREMLLRSIGVPSPDSCRHEIPAGKGRAR